MLDPYCSVDMFVHQKWLESRLKLHDDIFEEGDDYVTLSNEFFDNLWQPDPYFLNSKVAGESFARSLKIAINIRENSHQKVVIYQFSVSARQSSINCTKLFKTLVTSRTNKVYFTKGSFLLHASHCADFFLWFMIVSLKLCHENFKVNNFNI